MHLFLNQGLAGTASFIALFLHADATLLLLLHCEAGIPNAPLASHDDVAVLLHWCVLFSQLLSVDSLMSPKDRKCKLIE